MKPRASLKYFVNDCRFDTSSYKLVRPLLIVKCKKVIGLMKNGLGGKIMNKFIGLKAKTCSYLIDDGSEDKKGKSHKKVCHKRNLI